MPVRKALPYDHKRIAEIGAIAFMEDDFAGRFLHPYRKEYPEDYNSGWERRVRVDTKDYKREHVVSYDANTGEVAAWASWMRNGVEGEKKRRNWSQWIQHSYTTQLDKLYATIWPDKSAIPQNTKDLHAAIPLMMHFFDSAKNRLEGWQLEWLCTDPAYEKKGHGSALVKWGIELAEKEGLCQSVIAAAGRGSFYEQFGFVRVGDPATGTPLEGRVKVDGIMFRDAKEKE